MNVQELIDTARTMKSTILNPNMVLTVLTCYKQKSKVCGPLLTSEKGIFLNHPRNYYKSGGAKLS